jgi:spore coat polysaccharide biosynthesis protein SpsF (cytidylyltransferase family)
MYNNKKILAVVMARAGSKGLINKNLRKINKLSLVGHAGKLIKRISPKKGTAVYFPSNTYHASSPPRKTNKRIVINFVFNI